MPQPLSIATVNVNGVRAATRNGMPGWLSAATPDIVALQEVRAEREHLEAAFPDWNIVDEASLQKGRAGVAIISREEPIAVRHGLPTQRDEDRGRWIEADFSTPEGPLTLVSAYVYSGEADTPRQELKWAFLDAMTDRLDEFAADGRMALVTGDINVGHRELDIKNWRGNRKKAGFLPRERAYLDRWFGARGTSVEGVDGSVGPGVGLVDLARHFAGEVDGPYTWWSNRGQAFDNDTGWRIDYQLATAPLAEHALSARVDRAASYAERWSDHAPLVVDYALR